MMGALVYRTFDCTTWPHSYRLIDERAFSPYTEPSLRVDGIGCLQRDRLDTDKMDVEPPRTPTPTDLVIKNWKIANRQMGWQGKPTLETPL